MSKMSLSWHRSCLKNFVASVEAESKDVERRVAALEKKKRELRFYKEQVEAAEKRGMEAFDRDRLLVKRSA